MTDWLATLALVTGIISPLGFFIQSVKIIGRKSASDVSIITYLIVVPCATVWIIYGARLGSLAIVAGNAIGLIGAVLVIGLCIKYRGTARKR